MPRPGTDSLRLAEMFRLAQPDTPRSEKIASLLYKIASNYGQSYGVPLVWLLLSGFFFFAAYAATGKLTSTACAWPSEIFGFSLQQIVRPFGVWAANGILYFIEHKCAYLLPIKFIATLQSILSVGLLALSFLALRRRFRMG